MNLRNAMIVSCCNFGTVLSEQCEPAMPSWKPLDRMERSQTQKWVKSDWKYDRNALFSDAWREGEISCVFLNDVVRMMRCERFTRSSSCGNCADRFEPGQTQILVQTDPKSDRNFLFYGPGSGSDRSCDFFGCVIVQASLMQNADVFQESEWLIAAKRSLSSQTVPKLRKSDENWLNGVT